LTPRAKRDLITNVKEVRDGHIDGVNVFAQPHDRSDGFLRAGTRANLELRK
jgi:hypothetical protein